MQTNEKIARFDEPKTDNAEQFNHYWEITDMPDQLPALPIEMTL